MKTKKELQRFLEGDGFILREDPRTVHRDLARLMGKQRYKEHLNRADAMLAGEKPISEVYSAMRSAAEANMLMSFQGHHLLELNHLLLDRVSKLIKDGIEIAELGCWTGAVSAFLANRYPLVKVTGIDREENAVRFALGKWQQPNLQFVRWDYGQSADVPALKLSVLWGSLPIDFENRPDFDSRFRDGMDLSQWKHFESHSMEAQSYFRNWKAVAVPGASLVIVPRIPSLLRFAAFLDAAYRTGWDFDLEASAKVRSGAEVFPLCHFRSLPAGLLAAPASALALRGWWNSDPQ